MVTCPQCGRAMSFWQRDCFSGVCQNCVAVRTSRFGFGTFGLIAIIFLIFSRHQPHDLELSISTLRKSVDELKESVDSQTNDIKQLQMRIENLKPMPEAGNPPQGM